VVIVAPVGGELGGSASILPPGPPAATAWLTDLRGIFISVASVSVVISVLAGLATALQVAILAELSSRIGVVGTIAFSTAVSGLVGVTTLLVARRSLAEGLAALSQPPWLWISGLLGIYVVGAMAVAGARIGTTSTVAILIAGQFAMGAVIDQFGLVGAHRIPLGSSRVVGILLLAGGAALSLRK
jgi:transporter family-2 protein